MCSATECSAKKAVAAAARFKQGNFVCLFGDINASFAFLRRQDAQSL